ncbi:MAG: antibiotic biosynthesis monooxygenase [Lentisphaeria bacterium]|jgi:quinol monooxygenase YgiN|nr:antibiotic biosynthesis monooxygenase [Lentisphaeria bacterium]
MIYVIARAEIAPDKFQDYLEELRKIVPDVRAEEGCVGYEPCTDLINDGYFVTIVEMWESEAHWRKHMTTPHMARFKAAVGAWRVGNMVRAVKPL